MAAFRLHNAGVSCAASDLADVTDFLLVIRSAVSSENVVEPRRWFVAVLFFPGIPRENGLRFAGDKAPVVSADMLFF